jgi:protein-tyrosine phosphatase
MGCYTQVTAGSLTGVFGPAAQEDAWTWIRQGLVHFVSSDGHNTARRPVRLQFAFDAVARECGEELARALLVDNPLAALGGEPLPYTPELVTEPERRKKRFFFF